MDAIEAVLAGRVPDLRSPGVAELAAMGSCPQTAAFHGEGDVAAHTELVLEQARRALPGLPGDVEGGPWASTILLLGALLHDVGKPEVTCEISAGVFSARGHAEAGARTVAGLFGSHSGLRRLPLGVFPAVHALVRDHMWTWAADEVSAGAWLRMSHLVDPRLLMELWRADATGRICADDKELAERVEYAGLLVTDMLGARPGAVGVLGQLGEAWRQAPAGVRCELLRAEVSGELSGVGAAAAALARAGRARCAGSLTYTIGLPGVGKSTWSTRVWQDATGGVVLSAAGARRRDRRAAYSAVLAQLPVLLGQGRDVLVDATHMTRQSRDVLLAVAGRYRADVHAVYFDAPLSVSVDRQRTRPAVDSVPAAACRAMQEKFRWPTPDEYATLSVISGAGRVWGYDERSRWLSGAALETTAGRYVPPWRR